jgi:hypothetical protein
MLHLRYCSVLKKCVFSASEALCRILYCILESCVIKIRTSVLFVHLFVPVSDENLELFILAVMDMKWCNYKSGYVIRIELSYHMN